MGIERIWLATSELPIKPEAIFNSSSGANKVWNNNFVDNGDTGYSQAADCGSNNQWWGDPDCNQGNYWDDLGTCYSWIRYLWPSTCIAYCGSHNYYLDGSANSYDDRPLQSEVDTE